MSIGLVRDTGFRPAQNHSSTATPRQGAAASAATVPAGADPRSLDALTQALTSFLGELNGAAQSGSAAVNLRGAAAAYAETSGSEPPATDAPAPVAAAPASPFDKAFSTLKDDFDGLLYTMQSNANPAAPPGGAADRNAHMKASLASFVNVLNTVAGAIERANGSTAAIAQTPVQARPAPAATEPARQPAEPPRTIENKPAQRPTLFASLAARVHQHFEDL